MRLSHLQDITAGLGETLSGGQLVGTRGNTGNVLGKNGEKLTPEQLTAGRGAHVDVEITDSSGRLLSNNEQKTYLQNIKPFATGSTGATGELSGVEIETFNNNTFKPQSIKDSATKERYAQFIAEKNNLKTNKNVSIDDLLRFSSGGKDL